MDEGKAVTYPIAETFDSIQGEGTYSGVRMIFLRMAGCTVGKPAATAPYDQCTAIDGQKFTCDTNYSRTSFATVDELVALVPVEVSHVSITGGEPLNYNLKPLIEALVNREKMVHIETSGTVKPDWYWDVSTFIGDMLWLTCSPKLGCREDMVDMADELKVLVHEAFDIDKLPDFVREHPNVYLQPINGVMTLDQRNTDKAVELIKTVVPHWKLTTQMHKIWGVR